jgi:hypothetical protein
VRIEGLGTVELDAAHPVILEGLACKGMRAPVRVIESGDIRR